MQQHSGGNVARASALLLQMLAAQERHEQQLAKIVSRLENEPSLKSEQQMNRLEADEISASRTELVCTAGSGDADRDKAAEVADDET